MSVHPIREETLIPPETVQVDEGPSRTVIIEYPLTRSFSRKPETWTVGLINPKRDPRHPDFKRYVPGSRIFETEKDVDTGLDHASDFRELLLNMGADDDATDERADARGFNRDKVLLGEYDVANKFSVILGRPIDSYLTRLGTPGGPDIPGTWIDIARGILRMIKNAYTTEKYVELKKKKNPHETNAGWPVGRRGWVAKLIGALCAGPKNDWKTTWDLSTFIGSEMRLPAPSTLNLMMTFRGGPTNKPHPDLLWESAGNYIAHTTHYGVTDRARPVYMAPFSGNLVLEDLWATLLAGIKMLPGLSHEGNLDDELVRNIAYANDHFVYESDISGFDQSVRRKVQEALRDAMAAEFPDFTDEIETWFQFEGMSVITGPWSNYLRSHDNKGAPRDGFTIVGSAGGTHSGLKTTSVIGTLICLTCTFYALHKATNTPWARLLHNWIDEDFLLLCLGDDVLLSREDKLDRDEWAAAWGELGFRTTLMPGCRFLMLHRTPDGPKQVASRVIQNTLFPEYFYDEGTSQGMNALGFRARTDRGIPVYLENAAFEAVKPARWIQASGAESWNELREYTQTTALPLIEAALKKVAISEPVLAAKRDADFSPSATIMRDTILQIRPDLLNQSYSLDNSLADAARAVRDLDLARRRELLLFLMQIELSNANELAKVTEAIELLRRFNIHVDHTNQPTGDTQ
jgi:hypothetical protein